MLLTPECVVSAVPDRDRVRVVAVGELDLATSPLLRSQLDELVEVGWREIIVDLREVTFAETSTLHVLCASHRRMLDLGGMLTLVVVAGPVARLLSLVANQQLRSIPRTVLE
jgi:anti-anti-sigma factor